jgi:GNAT superfamily N-acetyltransferase
MVPGVTCRAAKASDLDFLVRATLGNAFETEGLRLYEATVRRAVKDLLADPVKGRSFVAEDKGAVIASLYVTYEWSDWHGAWYWWIQSLFVAPERRGQGVYTALYRFVREQARKAGNVRSIRLYVEKSNENGLRAYRGHGMKEAPYVVFEQTI